MQKLAIIADIHGNVAALEAVLADIKALGVADIVNLGDCVSGPLWPRETSADAQTRGRYGPVKPWPSCSGWRCRPFAATTTAGLGKSTGQAWGLPMRLPSTS